MKDLDLSYGSSSFLLFQLIKKQQISTLGTL